jgi:fumarate hydratase class II
MSTDSIGEPMDTKLFGPHTEAAVRNFQISDEPLASELLAALAHVKAAAAIANSSRPDETGVDPAMAAAIAAAAEEVIDGRLWDQFPVDVFQTGSGTSSNMNMNEVLATLAGRRLDSTLHPNDHVNASQSTNDTFPTAIRVAVLTLVIETLLPALQRLERELGLKADQFELVVKAGRTHLMDATPITLGQEFSAYRSQIHEATQRLSSALPRVAAVPLGGTATGNGLNAPDGYARDAVAELSHRTGLELTEADNRAAAQGSQDALVELSAQLRGVAVAMFKIANDLRYLGSGPRTGLAEIELPSLQPGSSIMPGKTNPVICEVVLQVCGQVIGNDAAICFAGTQGNLELNVFLPMIARNLIESTKLLASTAAALADRCVVGIHGDARRCREYAEATPAVAATLALELGYDEAARVVESALASGTSIREAVVASGLLAEDDAAALLDIGAMARAGEGFDERDLPGEDPRVPVAAIQPADSGIVTRPSS